MFSIRYFFCVLSVFSLSAIVSPNVNPQETEISVREFRKVDPKTDVVSIYKETKQPPKKLTYDETLIPNSWIVQLKEQPLLSYKQAAKALVQASRAKSQPQQLKLKTLLSSHKQKLERQQQSFIQYAKSKNLISGVTKRLTGVSNSLVVQANTKDISIIEQYSDVSRVTPNRRYAPQLKSSVKQIKADQVWQLKDKNESNITGYGVKIAILDTGIDYTHPDLGGCFGENCKVVGGYDVYNDDNDPIEDDEYYYYLGHGTHVAGIAAASGTIMGVAPDATLYAYKVCGADLCSTSNILIGLEMAANPDGNDATDDAVDIINLSIGDQYGSPDDPLPIAINAIVDQGIVIVVGAGNDEKFATIGDIASSEKAITVSATTNDGIGIAGFSSQGPAEFATFLKPEISAPGEYIESTCVITRFTTSNICKLQGTSMATPHVAGVAALILQAKPLATPEQVKSAIINNAIAFDDVNSSTQGAGLVDAFASVQSQLSIYPSIVYFGDYPAELNLWQTEIEISLENLSSQAQGYNLDLPEMLFEGITLEIVEGSSLSLSPHGQATITIRLVVDKSLFDLAKVKGLTVDHLLTISNGESETFLPIVFSKMATLSFDYSLSYPDTLTVFNQTDAKYFSSGHPNQQYYLPIGEYSVISTVEKSDRTNVVFNENIDISGNPTVTINMAEAQHQMYVNSVVNDEQQDIQFAKLYGEFLVEYNHQAAKFIGLLGNPNSLRGANVDMNLLTKPIFFSNVSQQFEIKTTGVLTESLGVNAEVVSYYVLADKLSGIDQSIAYNLNAEDMTTQYINVDEPSLLMEGVSTNLLTRWYAVHFFDSTHYQSVNLGFHTLGGGSTVVSVDDLGDEFFFFQPFQIKIHGMERQDQNNFDLGLLELSIETSENKSVKIIEHFDFAENNNIEIWSDYSNVVRGFNNLGDIKKHSNETGVYDFNSIDSFLSVEIFPYISDYYSDKTMNVLIEFHDAFYTQKEPSEHNVELFCDSNLISDSIYIYDIPLTCEEYEVVGHYVNYLRDAKYDSYYYSKFVTPSEITGSVKGALLFYSYLSNGELAIGSPNKEGIQVNVIAPSEYLVDDVIIEIKTIGGWQTLNVDKREHIPERSISRFFADIPIPEKAAIGHVRVTVVNGLHTTSNLIAGAMIIGKDQSTVFTDDFDADDVPDYKDMDDDNDGLDDLDDDFVLDATETIDTDFDGIGNNADTDDDADGVNDTQDTFPLNRDESADTDLDGIGNNADSDDDADGVEDNQDAFPLDANESVDTDNDGTGNNADTDDDGDGVNDSSDAFPLDASRSAVTSSPPSNNSSSDGGGGSLYFLLLLALARYGSLLYLQAGKRQTH